MASRLVAATIEPATIGTASPEVLVSAIILCLNEELTLGIFIRRARVTFSQRGIVGEVVIGDNGSRKRLVEIAKNLSARVMHLPIRGYGTAISAAANEARGKYLIMADADNSYDWTQLDPYFDVLQDGTELVIGNRSAEDIDAGAIPRLHRYFGNPGLGAAAHWLHRSPMRDYHCGMRGFTFEALARIGARSPVMEFASEMIIDAQRAGLVAAVTIMLTAIQPCPSGVATRSRPHRTDHLHKQRRPELPRGLHQAASRTSQHSRRYCS